MTTLDDRLKEREATRPDRDTLAWWHDQFEQCIKGYRGLAHACNCVLAEVEDYQAEVKALREELRSVREEQERASAERGRMSEALDRAREAYAELKKGCAP